MATNLTAIELGSRTVSAVQARANGQGLQILSAASAGIAAVDAQSLRPALKNCGVEGGRALLLIQRGQALLRDLELPAGSPDELVSMVRFQVEREMPLPLEQIHYSYIETGRAGGKVQIQVVAVPRDVLDPAIAAMEGAGVKISSVYISTFGLLSLYPVGEPAALVEVAGGEMEILIIDAGRMVFSRTAPLVEGLEAERVAEEVERTLLSYAAKAPGKEIRKVILAGEGPAATEVAQALRARLSREVVQVGPGDLETAAAAGICLGVSQGRAMPDLLNPPVALRRYRPTRMHRVGALAAIIVLLLFAWSQAALSEKRDLLAQRTKTLGELQPKAARVTQKEQWTAQAQQWYRDRNLWVDVLKALKQNINRDYLWIVSSTFEETGLVRLQGKSKDDKHVYDLVAALEKTALFQSVKNEKTTTSSDKSEYKYDFILTAHLKGHDQKKKAP
jgi:Tfp pilus assembly PilM family ATPase/Tfp pilus assembly protein PilN